MEWRPSFNLGNYLGSSSSLLKGSTVVKPVPAKAAVPQLRTYLPVQLSACMDLLANASASCSGRLQGAWAPCKPYFATPNLASLPSLPSLRLARASLPSLPSLRLARYSLASPKPTPPSSDTPNSSSRSSGSSRHTPISSSAKTRTARTRKKSTATATASATAPSHSQQQTAPQQAVSHSQHAHSSSHSPSSTSSGDDCRVAAQRNSVHESTSTSAHADSTRLSTDGLLVDDLSPSTSSSGWQQRHTTPSQNSQADLGGDNNAVQGSGHSMRWTHSAESESTSAASAHSSQHSSHQNAPASTGTHTTHHHLPQTQQQEQEQQQEQQQASSTAAAAVFAVSAAACKGYLPPTLQSAALLSRPPKWVSPLRACFTPSAHHSRCPPPCALATASTAAAATASSASTPAAPAAGTAAAAAAGPALSTKAVAVVLGYAVLIGSCFRSVPQILKVVRAQSTEGLSLVSNIVELLCYTIIVAYNLNHGYAFNTYGEVLACWLQDIVLVSLIFRHTNTPLPVVAAAGGVFALVCSFLFQPGACPIHILGFLQLSSVFIMALGSRIPQIMLNVKRGNAGMMSLTTCLLNVAGNTTRIFTTLVLTRDMYILSACSTQFVLNSILLWQCIATRKAIILREKQKQQQCAEEEAAAVRVHASGSRVVGEAAGGERWEGPGGQGSSYPLPAN